MIVQKTKLWDCLSMMKSGYSGHHLEKNNWEKSYNILGGAYEITHFPERVSIKNNTTGQQISYPIINIRGVHLFDPTKPIDLFLSIDSTPEEFEASLESLERHRT